MFPDKIIMSYMVGGIMPLVLFIDMDYFFAACEEARHPRLKSKALVVGTGTIARKERGVVQTCNYVARGFGIHSAMPTAQALKLKPDLVYLESDDAYYEETSGKVMSLLRSHGFPIEPFSIDEAAMLLGDMDYDKAMDLAKGLKKEIKEKLRLPCTIGISTGKTYAKMVCDSSKPDGLGMVREQELMDFLKDRKVGTIPGVGPKLADKLHSMGIETISQMSRADPNVLIESIGSFGKELYMIANGKDYAKVQESSSVLSIGRERTLERETSDISELEPMLRQLSKEVYDELSRKRMWFKGVSVKARYSDFTERVRNRKFSGYSDSYDNLYGIAMELARGLATSRVRKIGVRAYLLEPKGGQRKIF